MEEEPAQELAGRKSHFLLRAGVCIVLPAKGDRTVGNTQKSVIGDRDAVCVTCQIAQDLFGPSERRLGVNHPFEPVGVIEEFAKAGFSGECGKSAMKAELASSECGTQPREELPPEYAAQNPHRKQKALWAEIQRGPPGVRPPPEITQ